MKKFRLLILFFLFVFKAVFLEGIQLLVYQNPDGTLSPIGTKIPQELKESAYHDVLMRYDYPMCLALSPDDPAYEILSGTNAQAIEELFNGQLRQIHPQLRSVWVPTSLWEAYVITQNKQLEKEATAINLDKDVISIVSDPSKNLSALYEVFLKANHQQALASLFLQLNDSFYESFLAKKSPGITPLIEQVCQEERLAHQANKQLLYRVAPLLLCQLPDGSRSQLLFLPLVADKQKINLFVTNEKIGSYALSYGNSLFAGYFFSQNACVFHYLCYSTQGSAFHILSIETKLLMDAKQSLFAIPPLSPLAALLAKGEWFHAHTKMAVTDSKVYKNKVCPGWCEETNFGLIDHTGFLLTTEKTPEELGAGLLQVAATHGKIFFLAKGTGILTSDSLKKRILKNHQNAALSLKKGLEHTRLTRHTGQKAPSLFFQEK